MYNTMVLFMNYGGTHSKFTVSEFMSVDWWDIMRGVIATVAETVRKMG